MTGQELRRPIVAAYLNAATMRYLVEDEIDVVEFANGVLEGLALTLQSVEGLEPQAARDLLEDAFRRYREQCEALDGAAVEARRTAASQIAEEWGVAPSAALAFIGYIEAWEALGDDDPEDELEEDLDDFEDDDDDHYEEEDLDEDDLERRYADQLV